MKRILFSTLVMCLALTGSSHASAIRGGFTGSTFAPNDDGSVGGVAIGFSIDFFGTVYTTTCVNNNGNISFGGCDGTYTPFGLTSGAQLPRIAPFWADVDTRSAGDPVQYGTGLVGGRAAFGVEYINVDYFSSSASHTNRNDFEVILIDRSDTGAGNFDIEFNYDRIQWESGQASGSDATGHGGTCVHAGYTNGSGTPGTNYELPGSGVCGSMVDGGINSLTGHSNVGLAGRYLFTVREGDVTGDPIGDPGGAVPEPATLMLLGSGLAGLVLRRKRAA